MIASPVHGLYGVADAGLGDPLEQFTLLVEEGVSVVQLRCKGWPSGRLLPTAVACAARARTSRTRFIVNDDVDVARQVGAWVHLGQEDGETSEGHGRSTHTVAQVTACGSALYVGFGPVFTTATKATGYDPRGLDALAEAIRVATVPVVAIGGITVENIDSVRSTGVASWAAIGAIWRSPSPREAIRRLR